MGKLSKFSTVNHLPTSPPTTLVIKSTARFNARFGKLKSTPRSNRWLASVCSPKRLARPAMALGAKKALSKIILVVLSVTAERNPPMIPANAKTPSLSAITSSSPVSVTVCSLSNVKVSPAWARRTQTSPTTLSASNACSG